MLISQDLESKIYTQFDNLLGLESTSIFNGKRYFEKYRFFENNHPYYFTSNFENGDVTIENQKYYNVKIKYNLIEDNLILSLNQENNFLALTCKHCQQFPSPFPTVLQGLPCFACCRL